METVKQYRAAVRYWRGLTLASVIAGTLLLVPSTALASSGWSAPTSIDGSNGFESVSCPSSSFCVAVDAASPANVLTYDGSSWSTTASIDSGNVVNAVSCASSSFCVAVDDNGNALMFNGSSWSAPVDIDGTNTLSSVSCPSASFCAAVDNGGSALTYNGSSWSTQPVSPGSGVFEAVSCPSASFCLAALNTSYGDQAVIYNGSSWRIFGSTDDPTVYPVRSVSCVSSSFCAAVDGGGNAMTYNGSSWSAPVAIDPGNVLNSVSCPSASFCIAVDYATGVTGNAFTYNGSSWSAPASIDSSNTLNSVSCPSASFCAAVDGGGNALTYSASAPPPPHTLTVSLRRVSRGTGSVSGSGISCPGACSRSYPADSAVALSARAAAGSTFAGWSGGCTGTGGCYLTMSSDHAVTATFIPAVPVLSGLRLVPHRFHAARSGPTVPPNTGPRARTGRTVVRYNDSLAAKTTFRLLRWTPLIHCTPRGTFPGHGTIGGCRRIGWRLMAVGSFTHQDNAGLNHFRFSGRVHGRALAAGRYTLQATAVFARHRGRPLNRRFWILYPPR